MKPDFRPRFAFRLKALNLLSMGQELRTRVFDCHLDIPESMPCSMDKSHPSSSEGLNNFV
jgi:hypothetical protein